MGAATLILKARYISAMSRRRGVTKAGKQAKGADPRTATEKAIRSLRYSALASEDIYRKDDQGRVTLDLRGQTIFDARHEHADVNAFAQRLRSGKPRRPQAAAAHELILSLRREHFDQAGMENWREVTREVMATYETQTGRKLDWIASHHDNTNSPDARDHPHVHIHIHACYTDRSTGRRRELRLSRKDIAQIKEITGQRLEVRGLEIDRRTYAERQRDRAVNTFVRAVAREYRTKTRAGVDPAVAYRGYLEHRLQWIEEHRAEYGDTWAEAQLAVDPPHPNALSGTEAFGSLLPHNAGEAAINVCLSIMQELRTHARMGDAEEDRKRREFDRGR